MEEDIKLLENLIKEFKTYNDIDGIQDLRPYVKSLEHLIRAYKEKESKYNKALSDLVQAEHENKELKIKIDDKETELQILKDDIKADEIMYKSELIESYIPTSLVKENIEELSDDLEIMKVDAMYGRFKEYGGKLSFDKRFSYKYGMHDILQKLLERS